VTGVRKRAGAAAGCPAAAAIDAYLAQLAPARRGRGEALHRLVLKHFPDAVASLQYGMPHYRVGDAFFAWGSQKSYLSVYTCSVDRLLRFRSRHPEVKGGKGCLNFRDADAFPVADLALVVRDALAPTADIRARELAARDAVAGSPGRRAAAARSART
jgi:uncharacterized protein YdhG (YjbR/CyaY superfamily)